MVRCVGRLSAVGLLYSRHPVACCDDAFAAAFSVIDFSDVFLRVPRYHVI